VSSDPAGGPGGRQTGAGEQAAEPTEEELRAAYEAELNRITSTDMIAQAAVSLLNIGARRLGPPTEREQGPAAAGEPPDTAGPERDLEQARDAIDAASALLEILERRIPAEVRSLRDALSQLQMAYAREVQAAAEPPAAAEAPAPPGGSGSGGQSPPGGGRKAPADEEEKSGPGPAESSGRLWVPGR